MAWQESMLLLELVRQTLSGDTGDSLTGSSSFFFSLMLFLMDQREMQAILVKWYRPSPRKTAMARNTCLRDGTPSQYPTKHFSKYSFQCSCYT